MSATHGERHRLAVLRLYVLLQAAEAHPSRAPAVETALEDCRGILDPILADEGRIGFAERSSGVVVSGRRLRLDVGDWAAVEVLLERMHRRSIANIVIEHGVTGEDLLCLVGALSEDAGTAQMARAGLTHVQLIEAVQEEVSRTPVPDLCRSQLRSVFVARRLLTCIDFQARLGPAEQQRLLSIVAEELLRDEHALQAFTALEGDAEILRKAVRRCVNVVTIGRDLGIEEGPLRVIAVTALLEPLGASALLLVGGTSDAMLRALELAVRGREAEGLTAEVLRAADRGVGAEAVLSALV